LRPRPERVSSEIATVEVLRATRRAAPWLLARARRLLRDVGLVHLSAAILARAASLDPPTLRSLYALHVASAESLGPDLALVVAYDARLLEAAAAAGLPTLSPA
jgi:uncharacterized protein